MGGEGGSSFDRGKAGAFRNGAWGSGMCVYVCVCGKEGGLNCGFSKLTSQLHYFNATLPLWFVEVMVVVRS